MSATQSLFSQQLARASAQRGKLDPVYQDLSDHWSASLQRLYPVWALLGPGLADPGHIEVHSRTIYLDSDALLGTREQVAAGRLEPRAILRCFGVALHETFHGKHTKPWVVEHDAELADSNDPAGRQVAVDRRLLEEPRMEAHGVRDHPEASVRGRFVLRALSAATVDVLIPHFVEEIAARALAGQALTRDMAGRACVYLQARTHYGAVDPAHLRDLRRLWLQTLGEADLKALDELFAKLIWIADGDLDGVSTVAERYRQIIGEPEPPPLSPNASADGQPSDGSGGDGPDQGAPTAESLTDALNDALAVSRQAQLEQLDEDIDLKDTLAQAGTDSAQRSRNGSGTGRPTGRMPDRGVDRAPCADEVQQARRYAARLRQALTHGTRQTEKRTPGGKFNGRAYTRGQAQRASGRPQTSHPWRVIRQVHAPIEEPHVGLIIDTSGSMGAYEYALGPIAWIVTDGLRQIAGRCATALFGNAASLLSDGRAPLSRVPGIRSGGGTAFAGDAINLVAHELEMTNPRRPRFIYVLSDGGWSDTSAGVRRIRELATLDVPTIHLSIGIAPLSVECDRIHVITDPAQAMDHIAADTVAALAARRRRNH